MINPWQARPNPITRPAANARWWLSMIDGACWVIVIATILTGAYLWWLR